MANRNVVFYGVAASVFLLDRVTKLLTVHYIQSGSGVHFPFISFVHVLNTGTAFGLLKNASLLLGLFAFIVSMFLVAKHVSFDRKLEPVLGLILGGALGNLADRILYGAVIDMIDVHFWPVFNVADAAISVAIVLLLALDIKASKARGKHKV